MPEFRQYLREVKGRLRLDPASERDIVRELYAHLEEETEELCQAGFTPEEAAKAATEHLGSVEALAREMHQVHSRGSWWQAFLAALPHLLIALVFALRLWHDWQWLVAILVSIVAVAIYMWRRGKPTWLCPWLGYCLLLLLLLALVFGHTLPTPALWPVFLIYIPLALWLLTSIVFRVVRRDWLLTSLMMLPLPAALSWLLTLEKEGLVTEQGLNSISFKMALTFICLGVAAAIFIRLSKRRHKVVFLLLSTVILLSFVLPINGAAFIALALPFTALLLLPELLERKIGHGEKDDSWEQSLFGQAPPGE
jgi:hypothetical protein